jgi:hypothetical protein
MRNNELLHLSEAKISVTTFNFKWNFKYEYSEVRKGLDSLKVFIIVFVYLTTLSVTQTSVKLLDDGEYFNSKWMWN